MKGPESQLFHEGDGRIRRKTGNEERGESPRKPPRNPDSILTGSALTPSTIPGGSLYERKGGMRPRKPEPLFLRDVLGFIKLNLDLCGFYKGTSIIRLGLWGYSVAVLLCKTKNVRVSAKLNE